MSIKTNIEDLRRRLPDGVVLVAVSKFHPVDELAEAYAAGQRIFGESRAQELEEKVAHLPSDVQWHFIGHLQTNKVKKVVPHAALIHSIDSERLLRAVDDEAARLSLTPGVLLQVHVAREETKFGFSPKELIELLSPEFLSSLKAVKIKGVMGMASNVDDEQRIRADFRAVASVFRELKSGPFSGNDDFSVISMGMSHDWPLAVQEGSNMVRVGTAIFGEREY